MLPLSTLLKSGFTPTIAHFNNFFLFLFRNRKFKVVLDLFSQLTSNKINADPQTLKIFATALLNDNKFEAAADCLKTLSVKFGIAHQTRLIDSLVQRICAINHDPETGFSLLKDFWRVDGFLPSSRTFCSLIFCFSKLGEMERVVDLLELMTGEKFQDPFDNYVCSSVISGFSRIGEFELAIRFYENAVESGNLVPNVVTCTSVVNAYCKMGKLARVSELIAWMENNGLPFDVVFYSNWMYACVSEGLILEAFKNFRAMVDRQVKMDHIGYTILIDGFSKEGVVEKAVGFLYRMRRDGIEPNVVTYTAIILGFCKKGKLGEAFAIFDMLKRLGIEPDEFTYAVLIDGVCRKGDFGLVSQLLDEMVKKGLSPCVVTYNAIVNGLCKVGRTVDAYDISKHIVGDVITYTTLLQGYVQEESISGILETKSRFQESGVHMDIVMCNVLIKAMLMVGLFEDALAIYKGLSRMNLSPNSFTYYTLIDGYCKVGRIDEALEIFDDFRNAIFASSACYNSIILGACRKGLLDMAIDIFIEGIEKGLALDRTTYMKLIEATLDKKGVESVINMIYQAKHIGLQEFYNMCNDSVSLLCKMGFPEASCSVLLLMRMKGLELTCTSYCLLLKKLLFEGNISLARVVLPSSIKSYGISDNGVSKMTLYYLCLSNVKKALLFLSVINESINVPIMVFNALTNNGRILDAYELLMGAENNLPNMDVFDYSIMVDSLCKSRHIKKALNICTLAKEKGISLSIVTYNSVINGLCYHGCLVEAFRLYDSLERMGVRPTEVTYGTLIDALVREGLLHDAQMLFDRMFLKNLSPTTHIYNSLINGYCKSRQLEEAMKLFQDLGVKSLDPDGFTVSVLINGYCHKGDLEGALTLFFELKGKGFLPDFRGFLYLIQGLCAKGRMEESRSILREMLRSESIIELLGRVDVEVESDSVENLLGFLCEQGRIEEAVSVLNEVESIRIPSAGIDLMPSSDGQIDDIEHIMTSCSDEDVNPQVLKDFDSFYSIIHLLCEKGDLAKANRLTKLLMEF